MLYIFDVVHDISEQISDEHLKVLAEHFRVHANVDKMGREIFFIIVAQIVSDDIELSSDEYDYKVAIVAPDDLLDSEKQSGLALSIKTSYESGLKVGKEDFVLVIIWPSNTADSAAPKMIEEHKVGMNKIIQKVIESIQSYDRKISHEDFQISQLLSMSPTVAPK